MEQSDRYLASLTDEGRSRLLIEAVTDAGGNTCGPPSERLDLKTPRGPAAAIYLSGIDANGKVAKASARRRFRALKLTGPLRPYGSGRKSSRYGCGAHHPAAGARVVYKSGQW
jgi:hypothetical protein